jgi:hypothetical protein
MMKHFNNLKAPIKLSNGLTMHDLYSRIRVAICALLWAICNCRNDVVFNKAEGAFLLQVIHKATYWIHMWSFLQPAEQRVHIEYGCTRLIAVVQGYLQPGWMADKIQDS